jgi:membrane protein YqaA with SNARE-associated domain
MVSLALLLLVVFALNVLPAFAPPTWMVISYVGLRYPDANPWLIALVAAVAATAGRLVLAHFARRIVASRWVGSQVRDNLEVVAAAVERRKTTSVLAFLAFAFSPLPSNALFLAYGLTRAPLKLLVVPFFIGRFLSYAGAFAGGTLLSRWFEPKVEGPAWWLYFLATQLLWLGLVYAFAKIDWRRSAKERRLRLLA